MALFPTLSMSRVCRHARRMVRTMKGEKLPTKVVERKRPSCVHGLFVRGSWLRSTQQLLGLSWINLDSVLGAPVTSGKFNFLFFNKLTSHQSLNYPRDNDLQTGSLYRSLTLHQLPKVRKIKPQEAPKVVHCLNDLPPASSQSDGRLPPDSLLWNELTSMFCCWDECAGAKQFQSKRAASFSLASLAHHRGEDDGNFFACSRMGKNGMFN